VRQYAEATYGIPPEQVVGSAARQSMATTRTANVPDQGTENVAQPTTMPANRHPHDDRPPALRGFGNTSGDQQMLEYTKPAARAARDCSSCTTMRNANTPTVPSGLPDTKVGAFTQALYNEAKKDGWTVISMKDDWKKIFAFEE